MASASLHLLTGQVLGFVPGKSSPYQYLSLRTAQGDRCLKLSKDLRRSLFLHLEPGAWVRILAKEKLEDGEWQWKAKEVLRITAPEQLTQLPSPAIAVDPLDAAPSPAPQKSRPRAQVLVCQKSGCRKRGSGAVGETLATAIAALPDGAAIALKATGCMDRCKAGPNVVFMPAKARYSHVTPAQIPALVERHLAAPVPSPDGTDHLPAQTPGQAPDQSKMASAGSGA